MPTPIDPDDTLALRAVIANAMEYGLDALTLKRAAYDYAASAVARAVCPEGFVVVRRDDLETALYGAKYWGEDVRQDGEQAALDRLRTTIGDDDAGS